MTRALLPQTAAERRRARLALLAVCVGIVLLHAIGTDLARPINWDEAVHLTQVVPDRPAVFFEPHRTRGLSLLVAPIAVFDPSMVVFRSLLLLLGAAGTYLAFATWIPLVGYAAPLAAALYSAHTTTVFYTVELLPNHPSALIAVGVSGVVARVLAGHELKHPAATCAGLFLLYGLIRPPDAVFTGLGIALVLVIAARTQAVRLVPAMALGGAAAFVPWFIEGWVRFRLRPTETVLSASEYASGEERINQFGIYLASFQERLRCVGACQEEHLELRSEGWLAVLPPLRTLTFLVAALLLAIVAIVTAGRARWLLLVAAVPAVSLMIFYSFLGGAVNLRYLLPVVALALIPPAVGATHLWRRAASWPRGPAIVAMTLAASLLLVATALQVHDGLDWLDRPNATRARADAIATALAEAAGGTPCTVLTRVSYPPLQYTSGCRATLLEVDGAHIQPSLGELHSYVDVAARARAGDRIFAVLRGEPAADSPLATWTRLPGVPWDGFFLYEWDGETPIPDPPCPSADDPERMLARVLSAGC